MLTGRLTSHKADLIYIPQQLGNDSKGFAFVRERQRHTRASGQGGDREQKTHPHPTAHLIYIPQPLGNVFKGLGICDVVDEHDAHGSTVVGGGDGVETLLTSRVPETTMLITQQQNTHTQQQKRTHTHNNNNKKQNAHTHNNKNIHTTTTTKCTRTHNKNAHTHNNKNARTHNKKQNAHTHTHNKKTRTHTHQNTQQQQEPNWCIPLWRKTATDDTLKNR